MTAENTPWAVSLVRGDLLFRLQRKVGLIPEQGLGIMRRALFWSLLAWLPTAVWAWMKAGFLPVEGSESLLCALPFFSFLGLMLKTKKQGLLDYGDLISGHGRLVKERWIEGKVIADAPILDAPELGPIADTAAPYELIAKIRPLPLTMGSLVPLIGAAVLPMIILVALELPLKTILLTAMKILV